MTSTQLEFEITQWLDGQLTPDRAAALQQELTRNPRAQTLLEEYRRLNDLLARAGAAPQPDGLELQQRIDRAIDQHTSRMPLVLIRFARWKRLAVAATVLLALGLAVQMTLRSSNAPVAPVSVASTNAPAITITQLADLTAAPHTAPVTQIRITPAEEPVAAIRLDVNRPRIVIAPGRQPVQDTLLLAWSR